MICSILLLVFVAATTSTLQETLKIDENLLSKLETGLKANIAIDFSQKAQPVIAEVNFMRFESRGHKIGYMKTALQEQAYKSQKNVAKFLLEHSIKFQEFWINNRIIAQQLSAEVILKLARFPEVANIREEHIVHLDKPNFTESRSSINAEWNIEIIEATEAWSLPGGNNGSGVVVANIDTGVRYTHEALRSNFRSDYGWYDPYLNLDNPFDDNGHGARAIWCSG